jgi:hypothetical protein
MILRVGAVLCLCLEPHDDRIRKSIVAAARRGFEPMASDEFDRIKREGRALLAARKADE